MWTVNFQMFKLDLEKAEEPEIKLSMSVGSSKNQEIYCIALKKLFLEWKVIWQLEMSYISNLYKA